MAVKAGRGRQGEADILETPWETWEPPEPLTSLTYLQDACISLDIEWQALRLIVLKNDTPGDFNNKNNYTVET